MVDGDAPGYEATYQQTISAAGTGARVREKKMPTDSQSCLFPGYDSARWGDGPAVPPAQTLVENLDISSSPIIDPFHLKRYGPFSFTSLYM